MGRYFRGRVFRARIWRHLRPALYPKRENLYRAQRQEGSRTAAYVQEVTGFRGFGVGQEILVAWFEGKKFRVAAAVHQFIPLGSGQDARAPKLQAALRAGEKGVIPLFFECGTRHGAITNRAGYQCLRCRRRFAPAGGETPSWTHERTTHKIRGKFLLSRI